MHFNVMQDPWIPAADETGAVAERGIYDLLREAHRLRGISMSSPMEEYGIYRLLCAFVMDALRPRTADLRQLLVKGRFDMARFDSYLDTCRSEGVSFDLFDPERPFLQSKLDPKMDSEKNIKPISEIDYAVPSGNNHVLFEHEPKQFSVSPGEAARLLCAVNPFCTSGLKGPSYVNGAPPLYVLVTGENLFQTLVYSSLPENMSKLPYAEPPVFWRYRETVIPDKKVPATSVLLGMTFPARRLLLIPGKGEKVESLYFQKGMDFQGYDSWTDPHAAYEYTSLKRMPVKPEIGKACWRNTGSMLDCSHGDAEAHGAPLVVQQFAKIAEDIPIHLNVYGVVTKLEKYFEMQRSDLVYDSMLLQSAEKAELLREGIEAAEKDAVYLEIALKAASKSLKKERNKKQPEKYGSVITQGLENYYLKCQTAFWNQLCPRTAAADINAEGAFRDIRQRWNETIAGAVLAEFDRCTADFGTGAAELLEQGQARRRLTAKVYVYRGGKQGG